MDKRKAGRRKIEAEKRAEPIGVSVSPAVKRRLQWIAAEERISQAEWISQMINSRAEEIALERAKIDRPRSIRELIRRDWLKILDTGLLGLEQLTEIRDNREATEAEITLIAAALKVEESVIGGLEKNGYENSSGTADIST